MNFVPQLLVLLFLVSCNVKQSKDSGGLFSGHLPQENAFTLSTTLNTHYRNTQTISFTLSFPQAVTVTGTPQLELTVGASPKTASYAGGSGTTELIFHYTVGASDDDDDGINVNPIVNLNGGTLVYGSNKDCGLNISIPDLSSVLIDNTTPQILGLIPPNPLTYFDGQGLVFRANFTEAVTLSGAPRIAFDLSGSTKYATYVSGSGTSSVIFRYNVQDSDIDQDGLLFVGSAVDLNGGSVADLAGNPADLNFITPDLSSILVLGGTPYVLSVSGPSNGDYTSGNNLDFNVQFSRGIIASGAPRLTLDVGGVTRYASYVSGSGTGNLLFRYTVTGSDSDPDGISLSTPIDLNGGTIQSSTGLNSLLGFAGPNLSGVTISPNLPYILSVALPGVIPPGGFDVGENIDLTVTFSEAMIESGGNSRLTLDLSGNPRYAVYVSGSGTTTFIYRYTVVASEEDLNGLGLSSPLDLNGSTIQTPGAVAPTLTFTPPPTTTLIVDARAPVLNSNTVPTSGYYSTGENLDVDVTFHEPVTVSGAPRIALDIGGTTRYANYLSGTGSSTLRFRYTIAPLDADADGLSALTSIDLNGGTIKDPADHDAALSLVTTDISGVFVDSVAPELLSITPPADGTYALNANLDFTASWSEAVTISGSPRIAFDVEGVTRYATYLSGSGTSTHIFRYTVQATDDDPNGIVLASPLELNGGSAQDAAGLNATLTYTVPDTSGVHLAGSGPTIISVTPPPNAEYTLGQSLNFTVTYSEAVMVTLVPRLAITLESGSAYANYASGGGTNSLVFTYMVGSSDYDTDGIVLVSPLDLNGGNIQDVSFANSASLTFTPPSTTGITVDGVDPTIASVTPPANKVYIEAEDLDFTVNFNSPVIVTGSPSIPLTIGATGVNATYVSGSGSSSLVFRYTISSNEVDSDGVVYSSPIALNGGTIKDPTGDDAELVFSAPPTPNVQVDAVKPTISSVASAAAQTYRMGDSADFTVTFSESMAATGSPRIAINVGGSTRYAVYQAGSGTSTLTFRYTVGNGDFDDNGVALVSPLELNGGTLTDVPGNTLSTLTFSAPDTSGVLVDGVSPYILSVTPPADATYKTAQNLDFTVLFSENVDVSGTPRIQLTVGAATLYADYLSGSGSSSIVFRYTVASDDADADGIALTSPLQLNGGTIQNASLANAVLNFSDGSLPGVLVDGIDITLLSLTLPADKSYVIAENFNIQANMSAAAVVTGTPRIQLTVGAATIYADYVSGSGTATHLYRYTVSEGDLDANGVDTVGPSIALNGGSIQDPFGDNATLDFTGTNYPNKRVDGVRPTIASVTAPANQTYVSGNNIDFTVNFSEATAVTGSPRLTLNVGGSTKYATYFSGSGTASLIFRYTVGPGENDLDGIGMTASLDLNSGSITDVPGNALTALGITPPTLTGILVDTSAPSIVSVTVSSGTYIENQAMNFTVTWSENVNITGTPTISLTVGAAAKTATHISTTNNVSTFRYTVSALSASGDEDLDGIAFASLSVAGGTITDIPGNSATRTFSAPGTGSVLVDARTPNLSSVTATPGVYRPGEVIELTATFHEPVTVTGSPRINVTVDSTSRAATYASGSGTTTLAFRYTVAANNAELDLNGLVPATSITLSGGTLRDAVSHNAATSFSAPDMTKVYVTYSNMQLWYDFDDAATVSTSTCGGSNCVTGVQDKSGNGYNGLPGTAQGPAHLGSGFATGNNGYIQYNNSRYMTFPTTSTSTRYMVFAMRQKSTNGTHTLFYYISGGTYLPLYYFDYSGGQGRVRTYGNPYLLSVKRNNGSTSGAGSTINIGWTANQYNIYEMTLASPHQLSSILQLGYTDFDGRFGEFITFDSSATLSEAQLDKVRDYLNGKHQVY